MIDPYKLVVVNQNDRTQPMAGTSTTVPFTPSYVRSQLSQQTSNRRANATYEARVRGKHVALENPPRESKAKKEGRERGARRKALKERMKKGVMGRKEAKAQGMWKLDPAQAKFELFIPLHQLWMGYMSELLGLAPAPTDPAAASPVPSSTSMHPKLIKADYHGSIMTVRQSKNPCLVGLSGIVIHETENTFKVVTRKDQVKLLPKRNSIFAFGVPLHSTLPNPASSRDPPLRNGSDTVLDAPHMSFDLHGNQFCFRAAERAGRKFKSKESIEL